MLYLYDQDGFFMDTTEEIKNPLSPGRYLSPRRSCRVEPEQWPVNSGERLHWNGCRWEIVNIRREEIISELASLDASAIRPLRATVAGTATAEDMARLAEIEAQAAALRVELAGLIGD